MLELTRQPVFGWFVLSAQAAVEQPRLTNYSEKLAVKLLQLSGAFRLF